MIQRFPFLARWWLISLLVAASALGSLGSLADGSRAVVSPAQFRAACIRFFVRGITWPVERFESKVEPVRIGVAGSREFVDLLAKLVAGESVHGGDGGEHPIDVVALGPDDNLITFHLVYFEKLEEKTREALKSLRGHSVVTIGESPEFAQAGGILAFDVQDGKPVYYYSLKAMLAAKVRLDTDLLRLGRPSQEKVENQ